MNTTRFALFTALGTLIALSALGSPAQARPKADIELDPLAYAIGGHSVHAGIQEGRFRLDLGAFALDVPEAFHGNEGFDLSMAGFGTKLDYFPLQARAGLFVGAELALVKRTLIEKESSEGVRDLSVNVSARIGYRIDVGDSFFVAPWIGLGYASSKDRSLGGETFEHNPLLVFPTVHLGYRFP